jgi:transposase
MHPRPIQPVPEGTARVARAAFPKGNPYIEMRDSLETLFSDEDFAALFPIHGQPAAPPWRLALICGVQYVEGLADRQAADAVRGRIDWKYALSLELDDPGYDFTALTRSSFLQSMPMPAKSRKRC